MFLIHQIITILILIQLKALLFIELINHIETKFYSTTIN